MDQLTITSVLGIVLALSLLGALVMMPRLLMLGIPFKSPADIKDRMDAGENILVIDVRQAKEFLGELGHIPDALNLESTNLADRIHELGNQLDPHKSEPVVVMCRTHNRSPGAARALKVAGFKNITVMKGGVVAWKDAGYPTSRRA